MQDVPLDSIEEWPQDAVARLKQLWITTAEQVVAASSTPDGLSALADHLGISENKLALLIAAARSRLSPEVAAEMETPVDTSEYGIGALKPQSGRHEPDE